MSVSCLASIPARRPASKLRRDRKAALSAGKQPWPWERGHWGENSFGSTLTLREAEFVLEEGRGDDENFVLLIFSFKFGRNKWCRSFAFYLLLIQEVKGISHSNTFSFFHSFAGEPGEKKVCLHRDESIFPLLFNYFVASLLLVGTLLHSLLSPTGMIQMGREVNLQV